MAEPLTTTLAPRLRDAAIVLGLHLTDIEVEQLLAYLSLLQRWNTTYNLTAVRDPERMLTQHLVDCLAMITPLRRHVGEQTGVRLLDVGSGGGLPGIVVAVMCRGIEVVCVDTVGKKAAFIQQVALTLRLPGLKSRHARVEQLKDDPFDVVTSRAFASLSDFTSLTRSHLKPDIGVWLAMKGKNPVDERATLQPNIDVFHVEQLIVPELNAERCLIWMRPTRSL